MYPFCFRGPLYQQLNDLASTGNLTRQEVCELQPRYGPHTREPTLKQLGMAVVATTAHVSWLFST